MLPYKVSIVAVLMLELSLETWSTLEDDIYSQRVLLLTRFVVWLAGNVDNRRVLLHHDILKCVRGVLAALRQMKADIFDSPGVAPDNRSLATPDIRTVDWVNGLLHESQVHQATLEEPFGPVKQCNPRHGDGSTVISTATIVFQLTMLLCVYVFDTEMQLAQYLNQADMTSSSTSSFAIVDLQDNPEHILTELLWFWNSRTLTSTRSHPSNATLSLLYAMGGMLISGQIDNSQLVKIDFVTGITTSMDLRHCQIDELYIAWRILLLMAEQSQDLTHWNAVVQKTVDGFWIETASKPTDYISKYRPFNGSPKSPAPPTKLRAIYNYQGEESLEGTWHSLQKNAIGDIVIDLPALASCMEHSSIPDTRLRRALDTVLSMINECGGIDKPLPPYIQYNLASIRHLLHSTISSNDIDYSGCNEQNPAISSVVYEYVRFMWYLLSIRPLQDGILSLIDLEIWRALFSYISELGQHEGSCAESELDMAQKAFAMAGYLIIGQELLPHSTGCFIFSQLVETAHSTMLHFAEHRTQGYNQVDVSLYAVQGLMVVCFGNVLQLRMWLHESQTLSTLVSIIYVLGETKAIADNASSSLVNSLGNLSVVSLPDESVCNITDRCQDQNNISRSIQHIAGMVMCLLQTSIDRRVSATETATDIGSLIPQLVYPITSIETEANHGIMDLSSSKAVTIAGFAKLLAVSSLYWLLTSPADIKAKPEAPEDDEQMLFQWMKSVLGWIIPDSLCNTDSVQRQTRFLESLRGTLADVAKQGQETSHDSSAIGNIPLLALGDILALFQLIETVDLETQISTADSSPYQDLTQDEPSTIGIASKSQISGESLGCLVCESLQLLSILFRLKGNRKMLVDIDGGYRTILTCVGHIANNSTEACMPMAKGVLSLLSGCVDPFTCRDFAELNMDVEWTPFIELLYPKLSMSDWSHVLNFLTCWCKSNEVVCWNWSQSTLVRQAIEQLQHFNSELLDIAKTDDSGATEYVGYLGEFLSVTMGFSLCSADLKLLFRTQVSANCSQQDTDYTLIIRRMISSVIMSCAHQEAGKSYFCFNGQPASAICSPYFHRISERGFTFVAWIQPTVSYESATARSVLRLSAFDGNFITVQHNTATQGIDVDISIDGVLRQYACARGQVRTGNWHSIALCYLPAKRGWSPFGSSNLFVYVNGSQTYKGTAPFIEHSTYRSCYIGGSPSGIAPNSKHGLTFHGHISGVYMFDGALKTSEVELIHHLGPSCMTQFRKYQVSDSSIALSALTQIHSEVMSESTLKGLDGEITKLFSSGDLANRLIVCIDAATATQNGQVCLDQSPIGICQRIAHENIQYSQEMPQLIDNNSNTISLGPMLPNGRDKAAENQTLDTRLLKATQAWELVGEVGIIRRTTIHQALRHVGGIESLLILLYHLEWIGPANPPVREGPLGSEESTFDNNAMDNTPLPRFLLLLHDIIRGDPRHMAHSRVLNDIALVAYILERHVPKPENHLSIAVLRTMQMLQTVFDSRGGLSPTVYDETSHFWSQVQRYLILNLKIWRKASIDIQMLYLKQAHLILCASRQGDQRKKRNNASAGIGEAKSAKNSSIGIRWILYTLFNYYPYDSSQHIAQQLSTARKLPVTLEEDSVGSDKSPSVGFKIAEDVEEEETQERIVQGLPVLSYKDTRELRRVLLHTLELFLSTSNENNSLLATKTIRKGATVALSPAPEPTKTDITHLARHLLTACNRDSEHTRELLQLVFRCLADGSPNSRYLASKWVGQQGIDVLYHIIECDDNLMAAEAINIFVLLLTMSEASKEQETTTSRITSSLRGQVPVNVEPEDVSRVLALLCTKRALTPAIYRSLVSLATKDQASLLSNINIDAAILGPPSLPAGEGNRGSVYLADALDDSAYGSSVDMLPVRHIQMAEAWGTALELSYAPGTDPRMRTIVLNDLHRLMVDEPANCRVLLQDLRIPLLDSLVTIMVLGGFSLCPEGDIDDLADLYNKVSDHLELIPHTTIDQHMQELAIGHIRVREAWIERQVSQQRHQLPAGVFSEQQRYQQAKIELMEQTIEWAKSACNVWKQFVWVLLHEKANFAEDIHRTILRLWSLTPVGSLPLAIRLVSNITTYAQQQLLILPEPVMSATTSQWALPPALAAFAWNAVDMLLYYRQLQEYVAYHHEQLKMLSSGESSGFLSNADTETNDMYRSPHSPWDDTPELAQDLTKLLLQLYEYRQHIPVPLCSLTLRLLLSGIRSMDLQRVDESLSFLMRLLEHHPEFTAPFSNHGGSYLEAGSSSADILCSRDCAVSQRTFSILGYIYETYMFAEEHTDPAQSFKAEGKNSVSSKELRDGIREKFMLLIQGYSNGLVDEQPEVFSETGFGAQEQFVQFLQSSAWQGLYQTRMTPAMRQIEEEEMRQTEVSQARFTRILREHLVQSHRSVANQVRAAKRVQTSIAYNTLPMETEETATIKNESANSSYYGQWPGIWRHRLHGLTSARGPWHRSYKPDSNPLLDKRRWMLDVTENDQRMRRRLVRNCHYESHHLAAQRRDRTGPKHKKMKAKGQQDNEEAQSFDDEEGVPRLSLSVSYLESNSKGSGFSTNTTDEDWNIVMSEDLAVITASKAVEVGARSKESERVHFATAAERIALLNGVYGCLELTQTRLRFVLERNNDGSPCFRGSSDMKDNNKTRRAEDVDMPTAIYADLGRDLSWHLADIHQVHFRRYMLRKSAVEIFFCDHTSAFFYVSDKKSLMQLVWKLVSLPTVNKGLTLQDIKSPPVLLSKLKLTERWQHGELSNFDYLMALNSAAGRSYNDLTQYPVFPWIISDHKSLQIDLKDPKTYRDLSKPIGALNEKRLRHFIERYESFEDPAGQIKKFHYGTHYSSAASVAYYLIRTEPYSSVHVSLQSGKFDHADRQFHSVSDSWSSCMTGPGDVKELIPEFYYLPEFLTNDNDLDLGKKQNGTRLGDVKLPRWASTPEEFVSINRQALESEYVSANLHKWIDLIFGYKQRGQEAAKAHNVFYYLTYEDAVNVDAIQDPVERASVESQIYYFGQTPTQLFSAPHPSRHAHLPSEPYTPLVTPNGQVQQFVLQASNRDISFVGSAYMKTVANSNSKEASVDKRSVPWPSFVQSLTSTPSMTGMDSPSGLAQSISSTSSQKHSSTMEAITVVDSSGRVSVYQLALYVSQDYRFQLAVEPMVEGYYALAASSPASDSQQCTLLSRGNHGVSFAVVPSRPDLLVSCAHFDGAVKCVRVSGGSDSNVQPTDPLQRSTLINAMTSSNSHGINMTNAYASAAVGAMAASSGREDDGYRGRSNSRSERTKPSSKTTRSLAGLFGVGGGASSSSDTKTKLIKQDSGADPSASPNVFIPLAARLLDSVNALSAMYLSAELTCVSLSEAGINAVVGTSEGSLMVLMLDFGTLGSGTMIAGALNSNSGVKLFGTELGSIGPASTLVSPLGGATPAMLVASGLADPMDTNLGRTSMAAYASGSNKEGSGIPKSGRWIMHHMLQGHDAAVLDVSVSDGHDLIASASADGTVILWTKRTGQYLRSLVPVVYGDKDNHLDDATPAIPDHSMHYSRIERVLITAEGLVICYSVSGSKGANVYADLLDPARVVASSCKAIETPLARFPDDHSADHEEAALHVYNVNGRHQHTRQLRHHLRDIALTRDGKYCACVSTDSRVSVFESSTLRVVRQFELPACGGSITWSGASEQQLIVGCEGGRIVVISADYTFMH